MKAYLHIEVTEEFRDRVLEQAKKEFTNISAFTRKVLREYLGDDKNDTIFSRNKKLTTLEKEIKGIGTFDKNL